jgi:hypothetical protein
MIKIKERQAIITNPHINKMKNLRSKNFIFYHFFYFILNIKYCNNIVIKDKQDEKNPNL